MMTLGMSVVALSLWHLTPDASFGYFAWVRIFRTVGLPFILVPITSACCADVPPDQTNQASALINVARNLGGSIGVSMSTTLLARREQFHQLRLTEHLYQSSIPYQQAVRQGADQLVLQGTSRPDAQHQAIGVIEQLLQRQASLISYTDVYFSFVVVAFVMIFAALFLLHRIELGASMRGRS
jgi:MFS transporter, DHA2 family, multidrug resistance protein